MDFMQQIGGILQQYMGRDATEVPARVDDDFDAVARKAPRSDVAVDFGGLDAPGADRADHQGKGREASRQGT